MAMGYQLDTEGLSKEIAEEGSIDNVMLFELWMVEGFAVDVCAGFAIDAAVGLGRFDYTNGTEIHRVDGVSAEFQGAASLWVVWDAIANSPLHWHWTSEKLGEWVEQKTEYNGTTLENHTQTVKGKTNWCSAGDYTLTAGKAATTGGNTAQNATISLAAPAGQIVLSGNDGTTNGSLTLGGAMSLQSGGNGTIRAAETLTIAGGTAKAIVDLGSSSASLMFGSAGIKADSQATVISGTKIQIGLPGTPVTIAGVDSPPTLAEQATAAQQKAEEAVQKINEMIVQLQAKMQQAGIGSP